MNDKKWMHKVRFRAYRWIDLGLKHDGPEPRWSFKGRKLKAFISGKSGLWQAFLTDLNHQNMIFLGSFDNIHKAKWASRQELERLENESPDA